MLGFILSMVMEEFGRGNFEVLDKISNLVLDFFTNCSQIETYKCTVQRCDKSYVLFDV